MSDTPETDDAFDAFNRQACGLAYVRGKMADLERQLAEARAERDSWKSLAAKNTGALAFVEVERDSLRSVADGLAGALAETMDCMEVAKDFYGNMERNRTALAAYAALTGGKEGRP